MVIQIRRRWLSGWVVAMAAMWSGVEVSGCNITDSNLNGYVDDWVGGNLNPGGCGGGEGGVSAFGGGGVCATTTETNVANTRVNAAAPGLDDPARRRKDMTAFPAAPTPRRAPTPALRYDQCAS